MQERIEKIAAKQSQSDVGVRHAFASSTSIMSDKIRIQNIYCELTLEARIEEIDSKQSQSDIRVRYVLQKPTVFA